jgi:hypothetical protein
MKASHLSLAGFAVLLCSCTASLAFDRTHQKGFKNFGQFVSSKAQSRNDGRKDKHEEEKDRTGYKDFKNFGQFVSEHTRDRNQGSSSDNGGGWGSTSNPSSNSVSGSQGGGQQGNSGNGGNGGNANGGQGNGGHGNGNGGNKH